MSANVGDARGLSFQCQPGCGFCCTAAPLVGSHELAPLGPLVRRMEDGTMRIPIAGHACSALRADRGCGVYDRRPTVCHLYPYQVHAARRVQVTVSLACPGVFELEGKGEAADLGAQRAAEIALAQPGAASEAARAKETFAEFDRRMKEWNVFAPPDKLRAAFLPHAGLLADPMSLPVFFDSIEEGDLSLDGQAARAVGDLFEGEAQADLLDLFAEGARDAFDEPHTVIWVEPDLRWTRAESDGKQVKLHRETTARLDVEDLPTDLSPEAVEVIASYLRKLMHRDQTEGAAAWLVDASGYQATPAAAYARVLGEASLQVSLRASLLCAEARREEIDATLARRGIGAYETAYHSLPTLGAVL